MKHKEKNKFLKINLQLFADAEGYSDTGEDFGDATGDFEVEAAPQLQGGKRSAREDLSKVIYGRQEVQDADAQAEEQVTPEMLQNEFDELVKGKYKEQFGKRVDGIVKKRVASTKDTVDKFNKLERVRQTLSKYYNVDINDIDALDKAIENDDRYFEAEAVDKGLTIQQIREDRKRTSAYNKVQSENAELKRQIDEINQKAQAEKWYNEIVAQGEKLKAKYPNFDLRAELDNNDFKQMILNQVPVEKAYIACHADDLIPHAMEITASEVERKVANRMRSNASRPVESATRGGASPVQKTDVSKFSDADIDEIYKRAERGEQIIL